MRALLLCIPLLAGAGPPQVVVLQLRDTVQPASLRHVERGLREAAEREAALVVIELDTPGGLLDATRAMSSAILASPVPVVVHVTPSGARAASAGFFLLLSADLAAMAPGTNAGAAHPVALGERTDREPDPALAKAVNDATAWGRALAEQRGRPVAPVERAIRDAASFSARQARELGLVEIIAAGTPQLLAALDGRTISRADGSSRTLHLRDATIVPIERTVAERVLGVIASPQVAYLLVMLGAIGIMIELFSPGLVVPGVAGGLSLLVGAYGLSLLPVNVVGALLIAGGIALLVIEVFATSYGLLAAAGLTALLAGSLMLVDAPVPELRVEASVALPVAIVLAAAILLLATRAVRTRRLRARTGVEAMIGELGTVVAPIEREGEGEVFVHGERWSATSARAAPTGTAVRVEAIEGLRLRVTPEPGVE